MKIFFLILPLISLVLPLEEIPANYSLIFRQNFSSEEDFEANWDYEIGTGTDGLGNQEKQYYRTSKNNCYIKDNQLHIKAIKESILNNKYSSARIISKNF